MGDIIKIITEEIQNLRNIQAGQWSNDIFSNLLDVGTRKTVGYLPIETIKKYGGRNVFKELIQWAKDNGYEFKLIKGGHTSSGALYIWDINMLQEILNQYKDVLTDAGVPVTANQYVEYIEHNVVNNNEFPEAYKVIGITFNDKRFNEGAAIGDNSGYMQMVDTKQSDDIDDQELEP